MKSFLAKAIPFVAVFSIIRALVGIYIASYLSPADYAVILVPLVLFNFLDIYIEGGYKAAIIKLGVNQDQENTIKRIQFRNFLIFAPLLLIFFAAYDLYHADKFLPFLVVCNYCFISLLKIFTYTREGILVAKGKYVLAETLSFLSSSLTYCFIFYLIFNTDIPGYYLLCIWMLVSTAIWVILIYFYTQSLNLKKNNQFNVLNEYAETNRNVSMVFAVNNKIDELTASNTLGAGQVGLFAKFKEMTLAFGAIASAVITKPWFYVACNSPLEYTKRLYSFALIFFVCAFLLIYPVSIYFVKLIIGMMGDNWAPLFEYANLMLIFLFIYFLVEFSRSTLLACGGEDFVYKLEKTFFLLRIAIYSSLLASSFFGFFMIKIIFFIIIELVSRLIFLIAENIGLFFFFKHIKN